jgi:hypothetical protein
MCCLSLDFFELGQVLDAGIDGYCELIPPLSLKCKVADKGTPPPSKQRVSPPCPVSVLILFQLGQVLDAGVDGYCELIPPLSLKCKAADEGMPPPSTKRVSPSCPISVMTFLNLGRCWTLAPTSTANQFSLYL